MADGPPASGASFGVCASIDGVEQGRVIAELTEAGDLRKHFPAQRHTNLLTERALALAEALNESAEALAAAKAHLHPKDQAPSPNLGCKILVLLYGPNAASSHFQLLPGNMAEPSFA
jgi:hypothetical protein